MSFQELLDTYYSEYQYKPKFCVVMSTHSWSDALENHYQSINVPVGWRKAIAYDPDPRRPSVKDSIQSNPQYIPNKYNKIPLNPNVLAVCDTQSPPVQDGQIRTGSTCMPAIHAALTIGCEYTWCIEFDVGFTGNWLKLFEFYEHDNSDLLCTNLRTFNDDNKGWYWWENKWNCPIKAHTAAFIPIYRISRKLTLQFMECLYNGWRGHSEALLPTIAIEYKYSVKDMIEWYNGKNTMRFRPIFERQDLKESNRLYHPCKFNL